ncbi:hypothetical protein HA45_22400 [Pantoea rodasii]|uniref:hypothetical protein n=1 Tax=Pantoea rodasii TaxID=1076549 RepID=UPI000A258793|nr:hypothetical protein [Pantoea rodasii]ORM59853.1 hypothetical protein HA45_22400 [Pantoea rodasii]
MVEGISVWVPVISAGAGIVGALSSQWLSHIFVTRREKRASEEKLNRERYFIGTELVFLLEQFAVGCAGVTKEFDYTSGDKNPQVSRPVLDYAAVTGDWRALPDRLMYSIRELAVLQKEADRSVAVSAGMDHSFHHLNSVRERHYQYARLGIKAAIIARRLRNEAGFPDTRLDAMPWAAQWVLWKVWRNERHRRSVEAILRRQELARIEIKNALRKQTMNNPRCGDGL